ncbi:MAG: patatin-like phospholipase family protein [Salinisphaeraceae bacterium]|nr:patatin-like phospholipase family protein [Salinisphaeraceae bacterium]
MSSTQPVKTLGQWLGESDFGLTMSSGFFGFFAHSGMLSALEDVGLKPARLSGSSAGALTAALWASGLDCQQIREGLFELDKARFWDPGFGAGLLRGKKFRALLDELLVIKDFDECRVPLAVSVHEVVSRQTRIIQNGPLVPAVYASCCVPIMFQPLRLNGRLVVDGGVSDRPGLAGMPEGRVLYHHLSSRSPWRRKRGAHSQIPQRSNMVSLVIDNLPRSGPNKLEAGRAAFEQARAMTQRALDIPLHENTLRLDATNHV